MAEEIIEMKDGLGYIGDRTNSFRYADKDGKEQWVQQVSRYKALEPIKRGQAVSIATASQFEEYARKACTTSVPKTVVDGEQTFTEVFDKEVFDNMMNDPQSYIVLTNTKIHEKCIGLALQPAEAGEEIHVQPYGRFDFDTRYEGFVETTGEDHTGKEYNPQFTYDDVGKKVYVKYPVNEKGEPTGNGFLTVDEEEVLKYYHNIICLGYLTDAPQYVENEGNTDIIGTVTSIEISISGDQRGPIDSTQFEGILGEDVLIPETDPIRLFAIGQEDDSKFKAMLRLTPQAKNDFTEQDFIAFQKMDGKTAFISFSENFDYTQLNSEEDKAFAQMADVYRKFSGADANGLYTVTLNDTQSSSAVALNMENLTPALKTAFNFISGDELNITSNTTEDSYYGTMALEAQNYGGYYSLYVSTSLRDKFSGTKTFANGSFNNKGKVVLADIRVAERRNIIGLYNGYKFGFLEKGYSTIFLRVGEITYPVDNTHPNGYEVGKEYYLGVNGMLTDHPYNQVDFVNQVAVVKQDGKMIVDVGKSTRHYNGDFPVGYMKPAIKGTGNEWHTDYGYLLMDGKTAYKINDIYEPLYTRLLGWFPSDEVNIAGREGYFKVPKVIRMIPSDEGGQSEVFMEIKYLAEGIFEEMPRIPFKRDFGRFEEETAEDATRRDNTPVKCTIKEFDITDLIDVGINTNGYAVPDIDSLDIHLYVDPNTAYEAGAHDWHEVHEGFFNYNNTTTFGFTWKINKYDADPTYAPYGKYTITTDVGEGEGISYVTGLNQAPLKLNGCHYKLYVARKETFPRQFDLEKIYSDYITNSVYTDDEKKEVVCRKAVTGKAVLDAIANRFDVKRIEGTEDAVILLGSTSKPVATLNLSSSNEIPVYAPRIVFENTLDNPDAAQKEFKVVVEGNELKKENSSNADMFDVLDGKYTLDENIIPTVKQVRSHAEKTIDGNNYELNYADKSNTEGAIHGMVFGGQGNINVAKLAGLRPARYHKTYIVDNGSNVAYIPYVSKPDSSSPYEADHEGIDVYFSVEDINAESVSSVELARTSYSKKESHTIGNSGDETKPLNVIAKSTVTKGTHGYSDIIYSESENSMKFETLYNFDNNSISFVTLDQSRQRIGANVFMGTQVSVSLSKYKRIHGELIRDIGLVYDSSKSELDNEGRTPLSSNSIQYSDKVLIKDAYQEIIEEEGDPRGEVGTVIKHPAEYANTNKFVSVLGSALQAAYEMPLAYWQYNTEKEWYKNTLGIIIERVEDVADNISTSNERKLFGHITETNSDYKENKFSYSEKEIASIKEYLNSVVDQSSSGQNITDSVGLLLKAAKETQERLLKLEASTFGRDYETIPGEREKYTIVGMDNVVSDPTNYGLNRLIRAICVELYQSANPFDEALSNSAETHTSLSRLDKLDRDIHGVVNTEDNTVIADNELSKIDATTYPYNDVVNSEEVTAQRMSEFTPLIEVPKEVDDGEGGTTIITEMVPDTSASSQGINVKSRVHMLDADSDENTANDSKHFNGIVDAIYRITTKLNALTESVNNSDNIADTPVRLNTIRQNIEHIIREAYFDEQYVINEKGQTVEKDENNTDIVTRELERVDAVEYHDVNGEEHAPYMKDYSRLDKLSENLYDFVIHVASNGSYEFGTFKEFADETTKDGKQVYYTGRTFNGKALLTDNSPEEASAHEFDAKVHIPQNINDYQYASLIDIVVDAIGEQYYRKNAFVDPSNTDEKNYKDIIRHNKTISQRLDTIETALDKVVEKLSRRKFFEDEVVEENNKDTIYSIDKYLSFINTYLGFAQEIVEEPNGDAGADGSWKAVWSNGIDGNGKVDGLGEDPADVSIAAEYAFRTKTNIHAGLINTLYRLQNEESKSDTFDKILGADFSLGSAASVQEVDIDPLDKDNLSDVAVQKSYETVANYTLSDDIKDLLLTIYGYDNPEDVDNGNPTKYDHRTLINKGQNVNTRFVNGVTGGHSSNNIVDKIINEMYYLPDPLRLAQLGDATYEAGESLNYVRATSDKDSRFADYYNFDTEKYLYDIPDSENALSFHNRKEFFNQIGRDNDDLAEGQHYRLSRFEVIENEIRRLRDLIGLSSIVNWNKDAEAIDLKFNGKLKFSGSRTDNKFSGYDVSSETFGEEKDGEATRSTDQYNSTGDTTLLKFILNNDKSNRLLRTELGFSDRSSNFTKNGFDWYFNENSMYGLTKQPENMLSRHTVYDRLLVLESRLAIDNKWIDSVKNIANNQSDSNKVGNGNIFDIVNYLGNYTWDNEMYYGEFGDLNTSNIARIASNDKNQNPETEYAKYENVTKELDSHHQNLINIYDVIGTDEGDADLYVKGDDKDSKVRTDNEITAGGVSKKNTLWARLNAVESLNQRDVDITNVVTASAVVKADKATVDVPAQLNLEPRVLTEDDKFAETLDEANNGKNLIASKDYVDNAIIISENKDLNRFGNKVTPEYDYTDVTVYDSDIKGGIAQTNETDAGVQPYNYPDMVGISNLKANVNKVGKNLQGEINELQGKVNLLSRTLHSTYENIGEWTTRSEKSYTTESLLVWN